MTEVDIWTNILTEVVSGNLTHFSQLIGITHERLKEASEKLPGLLLTQIALLQVLHGLKRKTLRPDVVQSWASFMRRGYIASDSSTPISPIDIEYDQDAEDLIVEVLSRLDELGDAIDGSIDEKELEELIGMLDS